MLSKFCVLFCKVGFFQSYNPEGLRKVNTWAQQWSYFEFMTHLKKKQQTFLEHFVDILSVLEAGLCTKI